MQALRKEMVMARVWVASFISSGTRKLLRSPTKRPPMVISCGRM